MNVFICTHKKFEQTINGEYLTPLMVGAALKSEDFGYQRDDDGENISAKNPNYCELTGLYWIWKNAKDDILGLCHYRRYFDNEVDYVSELKSYDVILPEALYFPVSQKISYCCYHQREDFTILRKAVKDVSPDYLPAFDKVMAGNVISPYNMFIARREFVDGYCSWLFGVLSEAEKNVKISPYSYQQRVFGFMSERLMQVYVVKNKLNVKRVNVILTEEKRRSNFGFWCHNAVRRVVFLFTSVLLRDYCHEV